MRFTKLRLNGFKSFVDPTDLFIADGLTGVVGPNGCGKSNLLEALRWVMGENRPTAMRGGGMEDVIFAGAATRGARNYAEVSLVIDNAERLAPAAFNDTDTLEIVRRITRDAGSAYRVGAKDVRARDVQMLFADASTGSHSPALVRQGQISELINAKPTARRRILEEAAGISGLYQRRHEAELKLKGAEANLLRVDDVIEQLAGQLAQLARQARAAARYREIGDALRVAEGLLLYRRWRDADAVRAQADVAARDGMLAASRAETAARATVARRAGAEELLPPLREEEAIAGAVLQRLIVSRDALDAEAARAASEIAALAARIAQLDQDRAREAALNHDADETIARLDAEARDIGAAAQGHDTRLSAALAAAKEAAEVLATREADMSRQTEDAARLAARHQSAERLVAEAHKGQKRAVSDRERTDAGLMAAQAAAARAADDFAAAEGAEKAATATAGRADETLAQAEAARAQTQDRESTARAARSGAEGEAAAVRAEVAALGRLLARDTTEGGQVLDLLQVDGGFEAALGAALADDLRAPLAEGKGASGWVDLGASDALQSLPEGVSALAGHVRVPAALDRRMAQVGLVEPDDGARLQAQLAPGQRLVSLAGDLWRWDGFRTGAEDAPTAAALRLQQLNRLVELKRDLEELNATAQGTAQAHDLLSKRLKDLTGAEALARTARRDADRLVAEANRTLARAEADRDLSAGKRASAEAALRRYRDEEAAAGQALTEAARAMEGLGDLSAARTLTGDLRTAVEAARITMMARRSAHDELRHEGEARAKRSQDIAREAATWRARLDTAARRGAEIDARHAEATAALAAAAGVPGDIAARRDTLDDGIAEATGRRSAASEALALAETALREAVIAERDTERAASEAREARAAADARAEAARAAVVTAAERIDEALGQSPDDLRAALGDDADKMPGPDEIETRVTLLKRQRDGLGAVNLRAEEDAAEVQTEHETLVREKSDLAGAIATLRTGIASLNREGRERLLTAFEQVNTNFGMLFTHLFGGGEAKLVLVESDDPLDAGLEIMCQPPGKKLSTLSLFSGGEQTLTALALIFAVFLANPAPICVLDEVDAPLDDANVTRFCDLLDEMTLQTDTRFLVITHHAVTMARMDRLFGVTMGEQGVSQLVSVDLKLAASMVA